MNYTQIKNLVKELKKQGAIDKSFSLKQKSKILLAEIKKNITKIDPTNISPELAVILINLSTLAVDNEIEATKTPQKTTKKAAKSTKKTETEEKEMTQEEFNKKLIKVYLKEKRYQEKEMGVVAITTSTIKELLKKEGINAETFEKLYSTAHGVFKVKENDRELMQLALEKLKDGTYQLVKNTTGNQAA